MKQLTFILLCMINGSLLSQDTITVYFDMDWNKIQNEELAAYYRKAFPDSNNLWTVRDFFISSKLQMTGTYTTKKLESRQGHFVYYYENGQKQSEGEYLKDKREGPWTNWYENGQKEYSGTYSHNNLEGVWEYYHENGAMKAQGRYINNVKDGIWKYWYQGGQLECEEDFRKGSAILCNTVGYYENGVINFKGSITNGKRQGEWIFYNSDGRVILKGNYNKGNMEGEWVRYFREGNTTLNYNNGMYLNNQTGGIAGRP